MLHHLDVNVSDFKKSDAFYGALLPRLGWTRGDAGAGWRTWDPPRGGSYLTLVQSEAPHVAVGYHRKRVGLNHLAFAVETHAEVDGIAQWLRERGIPTLYGGPKEMGSAKAPNYAVFFEDPDRVKLEVVYRPHKAG